jgi:virginiamycin B lyase
MKKLLTVIPIVCVLPFSTSALAQARVSQPLPDGPGKALVENVCSSCHSVATITRAAGYSTAHQWHALFSTMIELPFPQTNTIAAYLAEHFPEDTSRRPNLIAGDVEIDII